MAKLTFTRNLFKAIENKNLQEMQRSLQQGADPSLLLIPEGISCLHLAVGVDSKNAMKMTVLLLLSGGNPNVRALDGVTPVHIAAAWGHRVILHVLLKYGGDVNLCDSDGNDVMALAQEYDQQDIIDYLNNRQGTTCLVPKYRTKNFKEDLAPGTPTSAENRESATMLTLEKRDQMTKKTTKEMDLQDQIEKVCPFAEGLSLESHLSSPETCICKNESLDMSQGTWYTVDEYLCVDDHEKVAFIEHKIKPIQKLIDCNETTQYSIESVNSSLSETTLKSLKDINDDDLLKQLRRFGEHPGPITDSTRRVYLRCLHKLRKKSQSESPKISTKLTSSSSIYSDQLTNALQGKLDIDSLKILNDNFIQIFNTNQSKGQQWKGGVIKSSFNYLLIDPQISQDLPLRSQTLNTLKCFETFINSIFYIGKGKNARPYDHLHEALLRHNSKIIKATKKVQRILDIWNAGLGVVSLHCFHGSIEVESLTREACLIDAIGLKNLTNSKKGEYHGQVAKWSQKDKNKLGVLFLYCALQIFLHEGERQIQPFNIGSGFSSPIVKRNYDNNNKRNATSSPKIVKGGKR